MLRRKLTRKLEEWKRRGGGALLVTGARQVGKSYAIREFARSEFESYVEINLFENKRAAAALDEANDVEDFISRLSLFADGPLHPHRTLIFIDEVQERPDIMTMAKFLVEDGRFDYVFSGSMLGTTFRGVRSFPVGYVSEITVRPMDFEEFCWAIGVQDSTLDAIREACVSCTPLPSYVHEAMMANYRTYLVVGGMPEAVQRFLDAGGDLAAVRAVQQDLNRQYRRDITQYAARRALHVREVFDQLPVQLVEGDGRFAVSRLSPGARYERNQQDFLWLVDAGVALKTDCVAEPKSPLKHTAQSPKFKLYQSDVGMLMARYPIGTAQAAYLDDGEPNLGAVYENAAAQELAAHDVPLYYFMLKKQGEIDFMADTDQGNVLPIEIKSGRTYRTHASLDAVLSDRKRDAPRGVVLTRTNVSVEGRVIYLPHYAAWCVPETFGLSASVDHDAAPFTMGVHPV